MTANTEEKKWYAVYTRPRWEKKVAELLQKKNIENYCPLNKVRKKWADRTKLVLEPLFKSYVFVYVSESEHLALKKTAGVLNLVYWLDKPAVIKSEEIEIIRHFLYDNENVRMEQIQVRLNDIARVISGPLQDLEGTVAVIKKRTVRMILPSLGFMMLAEVDAANIRVLKHAGVLNNVQGLSLSV